MSPQYINLWREKLVTNYKYGFTDRLYFIQLRLLENEFKYFWFNIGFSKLSTAVLDFGPLMR